MRSFSEILGQIGLELKKEGIRPLLVGGWAMNSLGIVRQTFDFDMMIDENDFETVGKIIEDSGYKMVFKNDFFAKFRYSEETIEDIDCLFVIKETFAKMVEGASIVNISGSEFVVPASKSILAMKLHALKYGNNERHRKDFDDVISIIRLDNIDTFSDDFKEFCLIYGNSKIMEKISNEFKT